jgi:hypothetical protein
LSVCVIGILVTEMVHTMFSSKKGKTYLFAKYFKMGYTT